MQARSAVGLRRFSRPAGGGAFLCEAALFSSAAGLILGAAHHLWLLGNHRPEVSTGGFAFWRRIRLIPFDRVVPDDREIDNLTDLLVAEEDPGTLG